MTLIKELNNCLGDLIIPQNEAERIIGMRFDDDNIIPCDPSDFNRIVRWTTDKIKLKIIELAKKDLEEIKNIESMCDGVNANYGNQEKFCLFCLSDRYDGKEGIKHGEGCVLTKLRNRIKDLEEVVKDG